MVVAQEVAEFRAFESLSSALTGSQSFTSPVECLLEVEEEP